MAELAYELDVPGTEQLVDGSFLTCMVVTTANVHSS